MDTLDIIATKWVFKVTLFSSLNHTTVELDFKNIFGQYHFGSESKVVLILSVLKANLVKLVIDDLILKAKLVLILTVLKVKFDCSLFKGSLKLFWSRV